MHETTVGRHDEADRRGATARAVARESAPAGGDRGLRVLQRSIGNRAVTRMLQPERRAIPLQRHSAGVLEAINNDLTSRRQRLQDYAHPGGGDLKAFIQANMEAIINLSGMVTICKTPDDLKTELAKDLANRDEAAAGVVNDDHRVAAARDVDNGGGGFTAADGTVYMLESQKESSALYHELMHVLSAKGGVTKLMGTKQQLNEGFTNYFAVELAKKNSTTIFPAYPVPTVWATNFVAKFGESVAYDIYFKDNEALLYSTLAAATRTIITSGNTAEGTKISAMVLGGFKKAGTFVGDDDLAKMVKSKIAGAAFMEAGEGNLTWLYKFTGVKAS